MSPERHFPPFALVFELTTGLVLGGCSGQKSNTAYQLDRIQEDIVRMRAEQAELADRVEALERGAVSSPPDAAAVEASDPSGLGPASAPISRSRPGPAPVPNTAEPARPSGSGVALSPAHAAALGRASSLAKRGACAAAVSRLTAFLVRYPDDPGVPQAMYLRGHCLLSLHERERALAELQGLVARFPSSDHTPDALFDIGVALRELGRTEAARSTFAELRASYPQTNAARRAPAD